jgi:hypothetical protein
VERLVRDIDELYTDLLGFPKPREPELLATTR